ISLPVMSRYGYDPRVSTGVIAASGTITQIIPPSLVLVVLADAMGRSVGDMYAGAFIPSFILVGLFCLWILIVSIVWPEKVPALPKEVRTATVGVLFMRCMVSMVPSLVLIFMVLGTILMGLATPTEGGAMGAVGALGLAILHRRLTLDLLKQSMDTTLKLTTMVMFILVGSTVFSLVFRGVDGDLWVESLLLNMPGGTFGFLLFVNVFVFFLAFFLDYFEIAFIIIPLLAPVAQKMGIDLIWFGVLLCVNMQTSFMHPPFGFALFYLRGIADQIYKNKSLERPILSKDIYLGALPWVVMQLMLVAIVIFWPGSVTSWLDKEQKLDIDKANQMLEQMGTRQRSEPAPADNLTIPAPSAPASQPAEDPMEAVRRTLEQDKNKKP
ncbi:MAG TPA: TRAP transporter large permease subunit, partial [Burkholderiaceae bacterium]|nr:TRAP transporter large permease subunit [Burkholderiaceae bacterium]